MNIRSQRAEDRGRKTEDGRQRTEVGLSTCHPPLATRHSPLAAKKGFTLVEMMLATSISIMVFVAMGSVLVKSFSLWKDATAHWRLAQVSRIARERILSGGFANPSDGLLSASNATVSPYGSWTYLEYKTVLGSGVTHQVYGWTGTAEENLWIKKGASSWVYGQGVAVWLTNNAPVVKVDSFSATVSNDIAEITYRLRFSSAGKTFIQPHTVRACLVNKED